MNSTKEILNYFKTHFIKKGTKRARGQAPLFDILCKKYLENDPKISILDLSSRLITEKKAKIKNINSRNLKKFIERINVKAIRAIEENPEISVAIAIPYPTTKSRIKSSDKVWLVTGKDAKDELKKWQRHYEKSKELKRTESNKQEEPEQYKKEEKPNITVVSPMVLEKGVCPDILTPNEHLRIINYLRNRCDESVSDKIFYISKKVIKSIRVGDFCNYISFGEQLIEIGKGNNLSFIKNIGYYLQAEIMKFEGRNEEAIGNLCLAKEEDDRSIRVYRALAIMYQQEGYIDKALKFYKYAEKILWEDKNITSPMYWEHEHIRIARHFGNLLIHLPYERTTDYYPYLKRSIEGLFSYGPYFNTKDPFWILDSFKDHVFLASMYSKMDMFKEQAIWHFAEAFKQEKKLVERQNNQLGSGGKEGMRWLGKILNQCKEILIEIPRSSAKDELSSSFQSLYNIVDKEDQKKLLSYMKSVSDDLMRKRRYGFRRILEFKSV